jgi:hypothetical protein
VFASSLALLALCAGASPAWAWSGGHGPKYTLKIVEGETTVPEYDQIASTSGSVEPAAQVALSIIRNGTTVYRTVQEHGNWVSLSEVPQVGEVVTLESPVGKTIGSVDYDGLPSIDPTVCAGSTNFSGENSAGDTVEGFYVTDSLKTNQYGEVTGINETGFGEAQVKMLSGTTFGGSFLVPLTLGETVSAVESLKTQLAGEATYTYISEAQRPVGACPPPPPAPAPPPPPPALQGTLLKLGHITILSLLKSGWHDQVTINQPGTVTQDLYLENGKLPAYAASRGGAHHSKKKKPPAQLLARGVVTATSAGTISVPLKLTSKGRKALKSARNVTVVLITTLRSDSGAELNLPRHAVSLHR